MRTGLWHVARSRGRGGAGTRCRRLGAMSELQRHGKRGGLGARAVGASKRAQDARGFNAAASATTEELPPSLALLQKVGSPRRRPGLLPRGWRGPLARVRDLASAGDPVRADHLVGAGSGGRPRRGLPSPPVGVWRSRHRAEERLRRGRDEGGSRRSPRGRRGSGGRPAQGLHLCGRMPRGWNHAQMRSEPTRSQMGVILRIVWSSDALP